MQGANTIGVEAVAIKVIEIWQSGGWLMLPLLIVTVFIYYTAFDLLTRLLGHPLLRKPVLGLSNQEITDALNSSLKPLRPIFANDARNVAEVRLHYSEVEKEYLPFSQSADSVSGCPHHGQPAHGATRNGHRHADDI